MIVVSGIEPDSLGQRSGFAVGDAIVAVNGQEVRDLIDFQVHSSERDLSVEVERDRELYEVELTRANGESFGLSFEEMKLRSCNNKCVFCFIHQMPKGMRRSLYFEDDDYRLSFLHGSYVTLTNIKESDIDRIIEQGLSPQYISVHATDPDLRQQLLGRKLPVPILDRIAKLAANGIEMHAQIVVCPGLNDGQHLQRTVDDLGTFYPAVRSVALVPVGLTKFRDNLPRLKPVTVDAAAEYVGQAESWGEAFERTVGERFVYAADELFLLLDQLPPVADYYDAFPQLENGIGMLRSFLDDWERQSDSLPRAIAAPLHLGLVSGRLGEKFMPSIVDQLNRIEGLKADLIAVENKFFGGGITVSGLLTGTDILAALEGGDWDVVCLPPNCVNGEGLTLDEMTVPDIERRANRLLTVGTYDLAETIRALIRTPQTGLGAGSQRKAGEGRQLSELGYYLGRRRS